MSLSTLLENAMLKRIQDLKSIGCFFNDHPASIQFEPLTFIFGENCYGKSTLCDIFRSLSDDSTDYITDRRSVPNPQNQNQAIQLNFELPETDGEFPINFDQNGWNPTLPDDVKIYVFDTDFIHRNVFTGLTIERRNQENITQFVLGEAGVRTAKDIEDLNSKLRSTKKESRQLIESTFTGIQDLVSFIGMKLTETDDELQGKITDKASEIKSKKELEKNLEKAKERNEPKLLAIPEDIDTFVEQVNTCLSSTYQNAHDDATKAVEKHIKEKTKNTNTTKSWLKTGLNQVAGDHCPFCGKTLEDEGKKLIEIYKSCFDEAFNTYERDTNSTLDELPSKLSDFRCLSIPESIQENIANINLYPELAKTPEYKKSTRFINASAKGLRKLWDNFQIKYNESSKNLDIKIGKKEKAVYAQVPSWTCEDLITTYDNFKRSALKYNELTQQAIDQINGFKDSLNPDTIAVEISKIENELSELKLKKKRLDSETACIQLAFLLEQSTETEDKIDKLKTQLENEQSQFLDSCFEKINDLFSRLGSGLFQISKQINPRGNMPVIQLRASYAGVPIDQDKLKTFFSESDRRALALSIFWAKIESMDDQQKQNSILVLDDPVTSFDDGRIDRTIRLMESSRPMFRQIIILSHYQKYLKTFFERASLNTSGIQLSKIIKTDESSKLSTASPADFVESEHQIKLRHIMGFIERKHTENVSQDLRIYLETEVKSRYRKQIMESNLNDLQFKGLLDKLLELNIIDSTKRSELEQYRLSLNPNHHTWTGSSHEDKITLSSDVLEYIYEKL